MSMSVPLVGLTVRVVVEGPYLDRVHARLCALLGPGQRLLEVSTADDPEPAELFLRLGERPVGHGGRAALDPDDGGTVRWEQASTENPDASGLQLGIDPVD